MSLLDLKEQWSYDRKLQQNESETGGSRMTDSRIAKGSRRAHDIASKGIRKFTKEFRRQNIEPSDE